MIILLYFELIDDDDEYSVLIEKQIVKVRKNGKDFLKNKIERIERNTKIICSRFKTVSLIRMNRDLSIFIRSEWMWEELNNTMTIIRIIRYFILIIKFIQNISSYKEWCSFTDELERVYSFSWKEEYLFSIEYLH